MSLSELEETVFAYYLVSGAPELTMAGRFFPYGEMVLIIVDKIQVATRKFGARANRRTREVATRFLDIMIERGAFSTVKNEFGGTMHQYQGDTYRKVLKELQEANPIVAKAQAAGPDFWPEAFAGLTA